MRRRLLLLPLLVPPAGGIPGGPSLDGAAARLTRAEALLREGKPAEALGEAEVGLEFSPEHLDLLALASDSAERAGRPDEALSYVRLGLDVARKAPGRSSALGDLEKRASRLDPLKAKGNALLEEGATAAFRTAEGCAARGHLGNAIDLFRRCVGTNVGGRASAQLERLYGDSKVAEALLEGALDLPPRLSDRSSLERAAKEDVEHLGMSNAWELRTPGHVLVTDVDRPTAEAISFALERMHRAYGEIFRRPPKKETWPRCTVRVYLTRREYEANEKSLPEGAIGSYSVGEHTIAAYDGCWDGRARSELWRTLHREGFRAFAAKSLSTKLPTWLEEGGACFFEGARFHAEGWLETGHLPEWRLVGARRALDAGSPTLEEIVTFAGTGNRPPGFADLSWALVHFLLQYEDERSQRIYRPLLQEYVDSFRTGAGTDPLERFAGIFVKKARSEGVATFEELARRFRSWFLALDEIQSGPASKADLLLERARKERSDGNREAAIESCRFALRKRPNDPRALLELADTEAELRRRDAALLHYRRAIEAHLRGGRGASRPGEDESLIGTLLARIRALDAPLAAALGSMVLEWRPRAADTAREYARAGLPREAIRILDRACKLLGEDGELLALRSETARAAKIDPRRWRRLRLGEELDSWIGGHAQKEIPGGIHFEGSQLLLYRHPVPETYRFEATIHPIRVDSKSVFGLAFGVNDQSGVLSFGLWGSGELAAYRSEEGETKIVQAFPPIPWDGKRSLRLAIDMSEQGAEFLVDDQTVGRIPVTLEERRGGIGLALNAAAVEFRDLRLRG